MRRSSRATDDAGSASIEFLTAGMLLLVPIVYLVILVASVQSAALATEGAARQAARVFVQAPSIEAGEASAARALELALADHGVSAETRVTITCTPDPADCLARRSWVTVRIDARVPLPLVPPFLDVRAPLVVPLEAASTQQVSRFGGAP
ncbi:hypothetical protein [Microcella alkalica]|uniref:TadE-like protein n=1 Tax=Microcella alkalica TaxID=355930 RepID=A0A839ECN2_9MICO|nr:hypothetical protein [Microcella alkalica]